MDQPQITNDVEFDNVTLGFPVPHDGTYECMVNFQEVKQSSKNNPMAVFGYKPIAPVKCTSFEPDGTTKEIEISDREIFTSYATIKSGALQNLKEVYAACKKRWAAKNASELEAEVKRDGPSFTGLRVKVVAKRAQLPSQTGGAPRTVCQVEHVLPA